MRGSKALWSLVALAGLMFALAWQHVQAMRVGYRLERLREEVELQKGRNATLRIELERRHSPERLEAEASRRLGLRRPEPGQVIVLGASAPEPRGSGPGWRLWLARALTRAAR